MRAMPAVYDPPVRAVIRTGAVRPYRLLLQIAAAIAAGPVVEWFVNRILRPDAEQIMWIADAVLGLGFGVTLWLWARLRQTRRALTDLERQQVIADAQLTVATRVQTSLLPAVPESSAGIEWFAAVEPAGKVGGDYYDFLPLADGRMCVAIADVSGKGIGAAMFLTNVRATLHALARDAACPKTLVTKLSAALMADSAAGLYATCVVVTVNPTERSLIYVNAGHPAGVLWTRGGVRALRVGGPPVGLLRDAQFEEESVTFEDGDLIVLVSDGVTEALDASGDAGVAAIAAEIEQAPVRTPQAVGARLLSAARRGAGPRGVEGWADDRTVVAFGAVR